VVDIGYSALLIAFVAAAYSAWAAVMGARSKRTEFLESAERGAYTIFVLLTLAMAAMTYAFITRDFSVKYVANYSNRTLPTFYTIAAVWAGQDGSLLLWAWLLSLFTAIVVRQNRKKNREFLPYVLATALATAFFFLILLVFATNPFERLPIPPPDGQGLNPLLQNPGMVIHPPTLYLGYVGFTIPFAFAMAALITRRLGSEWIKTTRRWTLFSWFFLTLGNLFGAQWAYVELGWGGYWAWDPVENASLMPWLTGTAFLHSVMIQEKKGMLKVWNVALIVITFALTIFGTFITRSGIISSVHSFGVSNLGPLFLVFLGGVVVVSLWLLTTRWKDLKSENELDSLISRESSFLLNNLLLVGMAFAVFWGTIFPIISEAVRGVKITVGPPFFNQVNVPIGLALLFLTGICPLIAWRKASLKNLQHNFIFPSAAALIGLAVLFVLGARHFYALVAFTLCIFVLTTIVFEFYRGTAARVALSGVSIPRGFYDLVRKNKRRYGGYIIHLGIICIFVGITGSSAFQQESMATLKKGESMPIGKYTLTYEGLAHYPTAHKYIVAASMAVLNQGKRIGTLLPEKNFYPNHPPSTEVAIRSTLREDLYLILAGYEEDGTATIKALINPLVSWIWIGGGVMTLGTVIVFWPDRKKRGPEVALKVQAKREAVHEV